MKLKDLLYLKRREREIEEKKTSAKRLVTGTAIGTVLGAVTGLLLAPKSGKETREDISEKTKETTDNVKKTMKDSVDAIRESEEQIRRDIKQKMEEQKYKNMFEVEINKKDREDIEELEESESVEELAEPEDIDKSQLDKKLPSYENEERQ